MAKPIQYCKVKKLNKIKKKTKKSVNLNKAFITANFPSSYFYYM